MKIQRLVQWCAAHVAWATMVFAPVALGQEAEKMSATKLNQYLQEFGLNQKTTVGEFWQKSKAYFPGHMYKEIETFVQQNRNVEMPRFAVSSAQGSDGNEVAVLKISQNGKSNTVQFYGEEKKAVKYNNTVLSENDLDRPSDIFKRLAANDISAKKEFNLVTGTTDSAVGKVPSAAEQIQQQDFSRFNGFPRITPALWKSLTLEQRASFIVKMRLMAMSAKQVLSFETAPKKTSKTFIELLFANEAFAQGSKKTASVKSAKACIVAGYVGEEGIGTNASGPNRKVCSLDLALGKYDAIYGEDSPIRKANKHCTDTKGVTFRACNPMQYSFPKGNPICIDHENDPRLQTATHRDGVCDRESPLSSSALVMKFSGKDYSDVQPAPVRHKLIEEDQEKSSFQYTKDFIEGMLLHGDKTKGSKLFEMFNTGKWDLALDKELVSIQAVYEEEIGRAITACHANIALKQSDPKQKGACDQLHRRWLFTEKFISKLRKNACPSGSVYIGTYPETKPLDDAEGKGLCKCTSDQKIVGFKEVCKVPDVVIPPVVQPPGVKEPDVIDKSCPSGTTLLQGGDENQCKCNDNEDKRLSPTTPPEDVEKLCSKSSWWKWPLIGAGILAVIALFNRKKKSPQNPPPPAPLCTDNKQLVGAACVCKTSCGANQTQNPESCACMQNPPAQTCAPKVGTLPNCVCPASNTCTPGQQIYDQVTCQCTNVPQPVKCANGSNAPNNNLNQCPKCPNGTPVPVGGCPVVPGPGEGGTGNNCPAGNCNSGGPPAGKTKK